MLEGGVSVGPVVSTTVTLKPLVPVLPAASVAEQETVDVPNGKVAPEAGRQVTPTGPSTASLAEADVGH